MAAMRKINDMARETKSARFADSLGLCGCGDQCSFPQQSGIFAPEYFGAKTHCRIDLRLSKGALTLSSVAEALEQRLSAVVEVLSKFRQGTLAHFVDR